jgi:hypothetical protein
MTPLRTAALFALLVVPAAAPRADDKAWSALEQGAIVLFRHAQAPGTGDPPDMRLGDCSTQRNLDNVGRAQAARIGETFRRRGIAVGMVLSSAWCRAVDTAELAFPGQVRVEAAFNSFFGDRGQGPAALEAARQVIGAWKGPGALVVSTHQVNITGLTGVFPQSGEGVVVQADGQTLRVVGRIRP